MNKNRLDCNPPNTSFDIFHEHGFVFSSSDGFVVNNWFPGDAVFFALCLKPSFGPDWRSDLTKKARCPISNVFLWRCDGV